MADFTIKRNDTRPIIVGTLTYSDGSSPNLTGASVRFIMRAPGTTAPVVNAVATIVTATNPAVVNYTFLAADTAVAGNYLGSWRVTFVDSSILTFPTSGYIQIVVQDDLISSSPVR